MYAPGLVKECKVGDIMTPIYHECTPSPCRPAQQQRPTFDLGGKPHAKTSGHTALQIKGDWVDGVYCFHIT